MKIWEVAVIAAIMPAAAWASAKRQTGKPEVIVCMNPGGNAAEVHWAQAAASRMFDGIGVRLAWHAGLRRCAVGGGVLVDLIDKSPAGEHPGALAYATPYDRTRIVIFLDRVRATLGTTMVATLLAHVMAHEIGHVLQGVERHSDSGILKPKWEYCDYVAMRNKPLRFTDFDVDLIHAGLTSPRASTARISGQ